MEKNFWKGQAIIKDIDYILTWINKYKEGNRFKYEIIPVEDFLKDDILENNKILRKKESFNNTVETIKQ